MLQSDSQQAKTKVKVAKQPEWNRYQPTWFAKAYPSQTTWKRSLATNVAVCRPSSVLDLLTFCKLSSMLELALVIFSVFESFFSLSNSSKINWFSKMGFGGICTSVYHEFRIWGGYLCWIYLPRKSFIT